MSNFSPSAFNIFFKKKWPTMRLAEAISNVDRNDLCDGYKELRRCAPRRSDRGKCYFVEHSGKISIACDSNREPSEEHLAIALWNLKGCWQRPDGDRFRLLDYQFPLQARQSDKCIGKVDLLGVTDQGRLMVVELKVKPRNDNNRGESPAAALMQGLRYAAIVEANRTVIAAEAVCRFNVEIAMEPPVVQVLAPKAWWLGWLELCDSTRRAAGYWEPELSKLTRDVEKRLGVAVDCVALADDVDITYGSDRKTPLLDRAPALYPIRKSIGKALPPHQPDCMNAPIF